MSPGLAWVVTALATTLAWFGVFSALDGGAALALSVIVSTLIVVLMSWWLGSRATTSVALASGVGCAYGWAALVAPSNRDGWWTLSIFAVLVGGAAIAWLVSRGAVNRLRRD